MANKRPVRILLVRHGLTTWNKDSRYQGHTDVPLSEEGLSQADAVGRRLGGERIDRIFSSDLSRARQTAEAISHYTRVPVNLDSRLRELSFGEWEGLTFDEIGEKWPDLQKAWLRDPVNLSAPGGETATQLEIRLKQALHDIDLELSGVSTQDGRMPCGVIVSHGGVIRSLISYASTGAMTGMWSRGVLQASVTTCNLNGDSLVLLDCNDVKHLVS